MCVCVRTIMCDAFVAVCCTVDTMRSVCFQHLAYCGPTVVNGNLETEVVFHSLLSGETHTAVDVLHRAMQNLLHDPRCPSKEYLGAQNLFVGDESYVLQSANETHASTMTSQAPGGCVCVPTSSLCQFHKWVLSFGKPHNAGVAYSQDPDRAAGLRAWLLSLSKCNIRSFVDDT